MKNEPEKSPREVVAYINVALTVNELADLEMVRSQRTPMMGAGRAVRLALYEKAQALRRHGSSRVGKSVVDMSGEPLNS